MKSDITLKVFGVPQAGLKEYHVTPNRRSGMEHLPPDEYRMQDEEIKSRDEYERDSQKTKASSSSSTSSKSSKGEESKKGSESDSDGSFDFKGPERKDKVPIQHSIDPQSMGEEDKVKSLILNLNCRK